MYRRPLPSESSLSPIFLTGRGRMHTGYCPINAVLASLKSFNVLVNRFIDLLR